MQDYMKFWIMNQYYAQLPKLKKALIATALSFQLYFNQPKDLKNDNDNRG